MSQFEDSIDDLLIDHLFEQPDHDWDEDGESFDCLDELIERQVGPNAWAFGDPRDDWGDDPWGDWAEWEQVEPPQPKQVTIETVARGVLKRNPKLFRGKIK